MKLPSGSTIVDLGAANSNKYQPYNFIQAFLDQRKTCTYVALDLSYDTLVGQLDRARSKFPKLPTLECAGLWGNFQRGDVFYPQIPGARLFLLLGSILFNAPDQMCEDRCKKFVFHLREDDLLIVGQDGPSADEGAKSHASYQSEVYGAFFTRYFAGI